MSFVTEAQVQQWLESTKLTIDNIDDALEATAKNIVFGKVSTAYDVTSWIDTATTPVLIQEVISMFIAAWYYNRAYSEDATDNSSYSSWLENNANSLLTSINNGTTDLAEVDGFISTSTPSFYPNDAAVDDYGCPVLPAFTMGKLF